MATPNFTTLLQDAVNKPGSIMKAYSAFHNYSLGNQLLALTETDRNCQGYARKRQIAVSPIAQLPHKTLFHEVAHVILGHTTESDFNDTERTAKCLREVEAEAVAMLCCEALELEGAEFC